MKWHTVSEVAELSGVSVRTLHHYHEIGLLTPALVGENRYRYYGQDELLRLQQILFYREFGISLAEIAAYLDRPDFDHVKALREHRARLAGVAERNRQLIETIDRTIDALTGDNAMKHDDLYKGFSPEKQAEYTDWLVAELGESAAERIETSNAHYAAMPDDAKTEAMQTLANLEAALAGSMERGVPADADVLDTLVAHHRDWVAAMWGRACPPEAYAGLAEMYRSHPDFRARYETIAPGFTDYLVAAMKAHIGGDWMPDGKGPACGPDRHS